MSGNVRPETMERITTPELAQAFIDDQIKELRAQIERIQNAGINITHADSHHYIHNAAYIAPIVSKVCKEYGITKIRLQRNFGNLPDGSKNQADKFNCWLRNQGFKTTEYFCRLSDINGIDLSFCTEILVHPDFDIDNNLIDRRKVENGYPVGDKIPKIKSELTCYTKL